MSVPAGKSRALLVYLTLTSQIVRRERLADLIWPDLPAEAGRFNLRHALFHLRRLCNPACGTKDLLRLDRDHVSLTPGVVEVDASLLLTSGTNVEAMLCQGDFMADFHLPGCDEFEEWLVSMRERVRLAQVGGLDVLSKRCETMGDIDAAIVHARQLTDITPYSDEARQRLMRLLAAAGRRQTVIAEFECFSSLLMRDLGVYPQEETLRLARELSVEDPDLAVPAVAPKERRSTPRRERRSATVLYCELANPPAADESVDYKAEAEKLFASVMEKHQGTVLRSPRWGMLAYFGYPLALEAAPTRAVCAALAASEAFTAAGMPVRCGLHLGFMVCDALFPDLTGEMAEIAQRLCLVGEHGEIIISSELNGAVAGRFATVPLGERQFRGLGRPFQLARVTGLATSTHGEGAPLRLFGRQREIGLLEKALVRVQLGETLCLPVYGAAGMGKSALASV
ncbi:MAG: BTAD domain-containing putative transcriptional regulator, partial [Sulfuricella sp.]